MSVIKKTFRVILVLPLFAMVALMVWMNATSGHFHEPVGCCGPICKVIYKVKIQYQCRAGVICLHSVCPPKTIIEKLELLLSNLDFNK